MGKRKMKSIETHPERFRYLIWWNIRTSLNRISWDIGPVAKVFKSIEQEPIKQKI